MLPKFWKCSWRITDDFDRLTVGGELGRHAGEIGERAVRLGLHLLERRVDLRRDRLLLAQRADRVAPRALRRLLQPDPATVGLQPEHVVAGPFLGGVGVRGQLRRLGADPDLPVRRDRHEPQLRDCATNACWFWPRRNDICSAGTL